MDDDLRRVERVSTDEHNDQVRVLNARLRAGRISRLRVEVAAYCGDDLALAALGDRLITHVTGYLCCCGDIDIDHGMTIDSFTHSPVHACFHVGPGEPEDETQPCDCKLTKTEEWVPAVSPPSDFALWVKGLVKWLEDRVPLRASIATAREVITYRLPLTTSVHARATDVLLAQRWLDDPTEDNFKVWADATRDLPSGHVPWIPCVDALKPGTYFGTCSSVHAINESVQALRGNQDAMTMVKGAAMNELLKWANIRG